MRLTTIAIVALLGIVLVSTIACKAEYSLHVSVYGGQGAVTPSSGTYTAGTSVTIAAIPDSGWEFERWEGDISGDGNPSTIQMDSDRIIEAYFVETQLPTPTPTPTPVCIPGEQSENVCWGDNWWAVTECVADNNGDTYWLTGDTDCKVYGQICACSAPSNCGCVATPTPTPIPTPNPTPTPEPTPTLTPTSTSTLKSTLFKNDPIAIEIIKGENYILNSSFDQVNSFEFKLMNALKQLGFSKLGYTYAVEQTPVSATLNRFRKIYGVQPSEYLDKTTLILLDNELAQREIEDRQVSATYPPFSKFLDGPINAPPKEHLGMLLARFFGSLPENIQTNTLGENNLWTIEEFRTSLAWGFGANLGKLFDETGTRELSIQEGVYLALNNQTNFTFYSPQYYDYGKSGDMEYIYELVHEYGHAVGYGPWLNLSDGQTGCAQDPFGNISFYQSNGSWYWLRPNNNSGEFVSQYARSGAGTPGFSIPHEDFAESFAAYILVGDMFRERAKSNIYLDQKYNFLKTYIFNGKEFDTGNLGSYTDNGLIWLAGDYLTEDPEWRWDYSYNIKIN